MLGDMTVYEKAPLFQRCQVYIRPLFFLRKSMTNPVFQHCYFLTTLFESTHIFAQIFSSETKIVIFICKLRLQTAKRVYKNQRTVHEYVNILFNQVYGSVLFFEDQVHLYMIGVGLKNWLVHTYQNYPQVTPPPPRDIRSAYLSFNNM